MRVFLSLLVVFVSPSFAADVAQTLVPAAGATAAPLPEFALTAYDDAAYAYLSGNGLFTSGVPDRTFYSSRDAFTLEQAAVNISYQPKEGIGGALNLTAGDVAPVIRSYGAAFQSSKLDLTQASVQYAASGFTVAAGKFITLAGAEVISSPADTNFSRSILFGYAEPFTHTGLRSTYVVNDLMTLYLGVNNGWDDFKDTNSSKTLESGASLTPSTALTLAASCYYGEEHGGGLINYGPEGQRVLVDIVATWALTEKLALVVNFDYGHQANAVFAVGNSQLSATWQGLAGYLNYRFDDRWKSSIRAEYFDDEQGYRTGVPQTWRELTTTIAYVPIDSIELRGEFRIDASDIKAFQSTSGNPVQDQHSLALQALFKY